MGNHITRRSFLGVAGLAGAGAFGLAACSPVAKEESLAASGENSADDYKAPPTPIADSEIAETIDCDICVVGAGCSGSIAAATAAEEGAKVVLLQKLSVPLTHGVALAAYGSAKAKANGVDFDVLDALNYANRNVSENRSDLKLQKVWAENSGELIDWLSALVDDVEGVGPINAPEPGPALEDQDPWLVMYPIAHMIAAGWDFEEYPMLSLAKWLINYAEGLGAEVRYETPAVQLRTSNGAVTGVIGQKKDGSYVLVNASKGVILAAGDYGHNEKMRAEYLPHMAGMSCGYSSDTNTGDGQLMGLWAGGVMQPGPHAANAHYDVNPDGVPNVPGHAIPWLRVNLNGERFSNEDVAFEQIWAQDMENPELTHFQIFDDNYATDVQAMGQSVFREPDTFPDAVVAGVEEGTIYKADTIADLATQIGVPADALTATVERYTQLAKAGYDEDYGKKASRVTAIEKAPFYAIKRRPAFLTTFGGLKTNTDMQVLNEENGIIDGLYAVGNCQGYFFGGYVQPMSLVTMANGRAATTGRVAALHACRS